MRIKRIEKLKENITKSKFYIKGNDKFNKISDKIRTNLKYELIFLVGFCLIISLIGAVVSSRLFFSENRRTVETIVGIEAFTESAKSAAEGLKMKVDEGNITIEDSKFFSEFFKSENLALGENHKGYVTDLDGKVIYKSPDAKETQFSIFQLLVNASEMPNKDTEYVEERVGLGERSINSYSPKQMTKMFPIKIGGKEYYFIYEGVPEIVVRTNEYRQTNELLGLLVGTLIFIITFLYVINRKVKDLDEISDGIKFIANGDLSYRLKIRGADEVSNIANNINLMASEIEKKIQSERAAEKTKSELITNVSHDLRTPLTSIMGYIGLLKDKRYKNEEEMNEYLNIAFNKSEKLKILIEDLFEYTKLNNAEMKIEKTKVNLSNIVSQIADEMTPIFEENDLILLKNIIDDKIICELDPNKMVRVLENILSNASKYSYKPGTVIIGLYENEGEAVISFRNRGDNIEQDKLNKLFDRFYRGDESRATESGGTGLGLAIAKSIVNMHGGHMWAECVGNDITFYIKIKSISN